MKNPESGILFFAKYTKRNTYGTVLWYDVPKGRKFSRGDSMTGICERNAKRVEGTNFREYHTGKFYRISLSGE